MVHLLNIKSAPCTSWQQMWTIYHMTARITSEMTHVAPQVDITDPSISFAQPKVRRLNTCEQNAI